MEWKEIWLLCTGRSATPSSQRPRTSVEDTYNSVSEEDESSSYAKKGNKKQVNATYFYIPCFRAG